MRAPESELPIVFEGVSLRRRDVSLLDSVTVAIEAGAPSLLVGPNGAGKTSLLRLAMGLAAPTEGRITWGGEEHRPPHRRAIVFQRPVMLRRSVLGNLRYALAAAGVPRRERRERAHELLQLVGLSALSTRPARQLSGGEQQRLALARALAKDPAVLLLDEPAANLDPAAAKAIEDLVRSVAARGIKVVMATHDLGAARRLAGEIVFMHRGRIVERSRADTFFSNPQTPQAAAFLAGELLV
jgi:tungstate transport system ATP-binding protein